VQLYYVYESRKAKYAALEILQTIYEVNEKELFICKKNNSSWKKYSFMEIKIVDENDKLISICKLTNMILSKCYQWIFLKSLKTTTSRKMPFVVFHKPNSEDIIL
jgi:hypothetical protein